MNRLYEELRNRAAESIEEAGSEQKYYEAVNHIQIASKLAREEGLIALDSNPAYGKIGEVFPEDTFLLQALGYVANGMESEKIKETMLLKYYAMNLKGTDAVVALMKLVAALDIQCGEKDEVMEERLNGMIPEKYHTAYKELLEENAEKTADIYDGIRDMKIKELCQRGATYLYADRMNVESVLLDRVLEEAPEEDMKAILEEVELYDLEKALFDMSGDASKKIFDAISPKLAHLLVAAMSNAEDVSLQDVDDAKRKIFYHIIDKINHKELDIYHFSLLKKVIEG